VSANNEAITNNNKIVVYMGFESVDDIISFLSSFTDYQFEVFANINQPKTLGNIKLNPLSIQGFHKQLVSCNGVISNAGFELSSECLV
jgi:uncharacterized protein (TIGR00661 family)